MAEELFIPKLGQTVEEVTLVDWKVKDGAKVEYGQEVMEVETDKAVFPLEANGDGYIHFGLFKKGDVVPVLTVVALIGKQDEPFKAGGVTPSETPKEAAPVETPKQESLKAPESVQASEQPLKFVSPRARKLAKEKDVDWGLVTPSGGGGKRVIEKDVAAYLAEAPRITPLARRVAEAEGVDLNQVSGTGKGGALITKADVLEALKEPAPLASEDEVLKMVPLKGVRGIIASRMASSVHTTARVTLFMDVDASEFVRWREKLKARYEKAWGFAPGYNDLLIKIAAAALHEFPAMNARLTEDTIVQLSRINVGLAVDTERGLMVPVVQDALHKTLQQIGGEVRQLAERARAGRSQMDDLAGGTFTITNLGMYDVEGFTPVINLPECAILGVGKIIPKPVYVGEELVRREMLTLSLVFDHRMVDGAPAARFLQLIKNLVEDPSLLGAYL